VRKDNYAYLLVDDATLEAAAIDPYDVSKIQAAEKSAIKQLGQKINIVAALTTHHHHDHSGGNAVRFSLIFACYSWCID
jgi:hydroxyacylglutathione hydrolase